MCDYYDIDQILQEDERVPCTFNTDAMNLGYLDPGHMDDDLEAGCKVGAGVARSAVPRADLH